MNKPQGYDEAPVQGESRKLTPGGHILVINKVEESVSKAGNDMIIVYFDTASQDLEPGFYQGRWENDTRDNKYWGGIARQIVKNPQDQNETSPGFKTFITSVEESNHGFIPQWDDNFCDRFKGKLVGASFGIEEYMDDKGNVRDAVKFRNFRSIKAIQDGIKVPEAKRLNQQAEVEMVPLDDMPF